MSCEENGTAANGQIKYNFIFGEDNLIFEGKGFDTALRKKIYFRHIN